MKKVGEGTQTPFGGTGIEEEAVIVVGGARSLVGGARLDSGCCEALRCPWKMLGRWEFDSVDGSWTGRVEEDVVRGKDAAAATASERKGKKRNRKR